MNLITEGEILQDAKNGKETPWAEKKVKSRKSAEIMNMAGFEGRAARMNDCAAYLRFAECSKDNYKKLIDARFCKDRLCPMCNWLRSRKHIGQVLKVVHAANAKQKLRFVFLTLTVRNMPGNELSSALDAMNEGFHRLFKYDDVDKATVGYVRTTELTYNREKDTYHPHIHVLMAVRPSYFSKNYISHERWANLWIQAAKLDYWPQVSIKAVKPRKLKSNVVSMVPEAAAVVETVKYSVKDTDYIFPDDIPLSVEVTKVLAQSLKNRRFIGYGKMFRQLHKELNLSDVEGKDADLVGGDDHNCTCPVCSGILQEQLYKWHIGFYISVEDPV